MNIATLLELAKISPYLVIPALAGFLLYKVNKEYMKFLQGIIDDRGTQFESLTKDIRSLNENLSAKLEGHDKSFQERIEKILDLLNEYRLEAVRGGSNK